MLSLETIWTFFFASLLMAMTPGPDVIIVLTQSSLYGMRAGLLTTFGLMTGLLGHTLAVALGVAVLFQTSEAAFTALKLLGAAYLLYLAYQSFRSGVFRASFPTSPIPRSRCSASPCCPSSSGRNTGIPPSRYSSSAGCTNWPASSCSEPSPRSAEGWRRGSTVRCAPSCL